MSIESHLKTKPKDVITYYRQHGLWALLKSVLRRLGFICHNRTLLFFHVDLTKFANGFTGPFTIHLATVEEVEREQDYYDGWFTKEHAIMNLLNGYQLFIFKQNGQIATYQWLVFKTVKIDWLEMHFDIPADYVYYQAIYTIPELRGSGLGSKTNWEVFSYLKRKGYNHVLLVIDPDNTPSIRLFTHNGAENYLRVHYRRYWLVRYYHVKKINSSESKTYIIPFMAPRDIWKTYLK